LTDEAQPRPVAGRLPPATVSEYIAEYSATPVLDRVRLCALGLLDMKPEELKAADLFLKKTAPDLKSVDHTGMVKGAFTLTMTPRDAAL
jgi:hypothetical protein